MPIYELECAACADITEVMQKEKYTQEELNDLQCLKCTEIGVMYYIMSGGGFRLYGIGVYKPSER